ncbi:MAG: serine hydrolase [Chloroflexota bacterium]
MGFRLHTRLLFWGALFGLLLLLPLAQPPVASVDAVEGPRRHVVKAGDTLSSIALEHGVAIDEVISLNSIANPNRIGEGATLKLPVGAGASGQREYIVRPGDSLSSIAASNGTNLAAVLELNELENPHRLRVGQRLNLPPGGAVSQSPQAPPQSAAQRPPATQVTTPTAQAAILKLIQSKAPAGARVGIHAVNLSTGERVEHRAYETFPAASVAKLAVLVEVQRQVDAGTITLTDAIRNDMRNMIVLSDNPSANRLINLVTSARINTTMAQLGYKSTVLRNLFEGAALPGWTGQLNQTSPADMVALLTKMSTEQLLSPTSSRAMRDLLLATRDGSRLPRLLPPEARIAHKSGWYTGVSNDVGIIYAPTGRFVVAVFTTGSNDAVAENQFISEVGQTLYRTWAQKPG